MVDSDETNIVTYCVVGGVLALVAIFAGLAICRRERQQYYLLDNLMDQDTPEHPPLRRVTSAPPKSLGHKRVNSN